MTDIVKRRWQTCTVAADSRYPRRSMKDQPGVIPSLMEVLAEALDHAEKEVRHLRALTETSERQLKRYANKESYPPGGELDDLVEVYATAVDIPALALWQRGIERAATKAGASQSVVRGARDLAEAIDRAPLRRS